MLESLITHLHQTVGILHKRDIQTAARRLHPGIPTALQSSAETDLHRIRPGDDCAAIPDGKGYLLLAAEGMLPDFVAQEPWFAGWCGVMVNVSDIYAMGGTPIAIVDALWSSSEQASHLVWEGMQAASRAYGVPIVGGHTNCHSPHESLAAAILGRATERLITSFDARPGDCLMVAIDLRGDFFRQYPFWNAATNAPSERLQGDLALLPALAQAGLCRAGKDISMGGIAGTLLMLMETSGCGAVLDVDKLPRPTAIPLEKWLTCFPSFGFLLSVAPKDIDQVQQLMNQRHLACEPVGIVTQGNQVFLQSDHTKALLWDLAANPLTGFGK